MDNAIYFKVIAAGIETLAEDISVPKETVIQQLNTLKDKISICLDNLEEE